MTPAPGVRFGRLIVIRASVRDRYWLCVCDCGKEKEVRRDHLRTGKIQSCGCLSRHHLTGFRFGRWTVKEAAPNRSNHTYWVCQCDCGATAAVATCTLLDGTSQSCGCLMRERNSEAKTTHGHCRGGDCHPEYVLWTGMIQRCYNPNQPSYEAYKDRGVCDRWRFGEGGLTGFECFLADMGPRPSRKLTIERIENDLGYSPLNCIWATYTQQARNKRTTVWININNVLGVPLSSALRMLGLPDWAWGYYRLTKSGLTPQQAFDEIAKGRTLNLPQHPNVGLLHQDEKPSAGS